jgi:hypothetical protein
MASLEQILSTGKSFTVDDMACMEHADVLKKYERPVEVFLWSSMPKEIQLTFKVAFISICHQFNWDYMQDTLAKNLLNQDRDIVDILIGLKSTDIDTWLKDYPKKERIRAKERAGILRNVGQVLKEQYGGDLDLFYKKCNGTNIGDEESNTAAEFHQIMDQFLGYRTDSLRKKTNVLTHDLYKEAIIDFADEKNVRPAVDYHIMRTYVRTGRVVPIDPILFRYLEGAPNPRGSLVRQLRKAVSEAEKLTAFYAGLNVADVNYIEWQIGRSICENKDPLCVSENKSFITAEDIYPLCSGSCPFINNCRSYNDYSGFKDLSQFISFEEPKYISTNY